MKRKLICVIAVAVLLSAAVLGMLHLNTSDRGHFNVLQANWDVTIPKQAGCQIIYQNDQRGGFHGDGLSYYVYTCENGGAMDGLFDWQTTQTPHADCETWLDALGVPDDVRPPYTKCGMKCMTKSGGDELLLWWDSVNRLLYVVESYM